MLNYFIHLIFFILLYNNVLAEENIKLLNNITSYQELINSHVVKQNLDNSCGAASLSTVLQYVFNDSNATEKLILEQIGQKTTTGKEILKVITTQYQDDLNKVLTGLNKTPEDQISSDENLSKQLEKLDVRVSLTIGLAIAKLVSVNVVDLTTTARKLGYEEKADCLLPTHLQEKNLTIKEVVRKLGTAVNNKQIPPFIVRIKPLLIDNTHFSIFRGSCQDESGEYIYLADPSKGNVRFSLAQFIDIWFTQLINTDEQTGCKGGYRILINKSDSPFSDLLLVSKNEQLGVCPIR